MIILIKKDRGRCPHCGTWKKLIYNEKMNQRELHCCKLYGIHNEIKEEKKKK